MEFDREPNYRAEEAVVISCRFNEEVDSTEAIIETTDKELGNKKN